MVYYDGSVTTRIRCPRRIPTATTALCILVGVLFVPSVGAQAAALPGGGPPAGPSSGTPMLTTTGTWQVDAADRAAGTPTLREGDRISAVVTVTNTTGSSISDLALVGVGIDGTCDTTTLAPGALTTCHTRTHRIDHVDAAIGAVTLSLRTEGFTDQGLLVRSAPTTIDERAVSASAEFPAGADTADRTAAAVGVAGALAGLGALAGAIATHVRGGRRPRLRDAR